eukprot:scaffold125608_cov27-Tisochrysis_lutea.AAC.2
MHRNEDGYRREAFRVYMYLPELDETEGHGDGEETWRLWPFTGDHGDVPPIFSSNWNPITIQVPHINNRRTQSKFILIGSPLLGPWGGTHEHSPSPPPPLLPCRGGEEPPTLVARLMACQEHTAMVTHSPAPTKMG